MQCTLNIHFGNGNSAPRKVLFSCTGAKAEYSKVASPREIKNGVRTEILQKMENPSCACALAFTCSRYCATGYTVFLS